MAATNYTPIKLYSSGTATNTPLAANLAAGELAINTADGILFYKDSSNVVQKIGYKLTPTTAGGTGLTSFTNGGIVYASSTSALATGSALVFDGTNLGVGSASLSSASGRVDVTINGTSSSMVSFGTGGTRRGYMIHDGTDLTIANEQAAGALRWVTSAGESMRIATATGGVGAVGIGYSSLTSVGNNGLAVLGNVGIGTSSPSTKLDIAGTLRIDTTSNIYGKTDNTSFVSLYGGGAYNSGAGIGLGGTSQSVNPNTIIFTRGAYVETARFDSSGNLGLGVTPSAWSAGGKIIELGFKGNILYGVAYTAFGLSNNAYYDATAPSGWKFANPTSSRASYYEQSQGTHAWATSTAAGTAGNAISFTQAMTLTAGGVLQVNTTQTVGTGNVAMFGTMTGNTPGIVRIGSFDQALPTLALTNWFGGATNNGCYVSFDNSGRGGFVIGASAGTNNFDICRAWGTPDIRIDSSGNLLVGTTATSVTGSTGFRVFPSGIIASTLAGSTSATDTFEIYSTGASAYRFYVTMDGKINCTSTTIAGISDQRFKENIVDLDAGLNSIMALKPRKFDWKEGKGKDIKGDRGFIAQEFEEVFPDLIGKWKDEPPEGEEPYKTVSADLIPVLVKAIQEQQALITQLTARITALESA